MTWVERWFRYLLTWRRHRNTVKALNRLSDQQLKDIGLDRSSIDSMIWLEIDKEARGD